MGTRRLLLRTTAALGVAAGIAAIMPFIASLKPSASAIASLPRIDISDLKIDSYKVAIFSPKLGYRQDRNSKEGALLVNDHSGHITAWRVLVQDGQVLMPDLHWYRTFYPCRDLFIDSFNGRLVGPIHCRDSDVSTFWQREWHWDLNGKNLGRMTDDLIPIRGFIEGHEFAMKL